MTALVRGTLWLPGVLSRRAYSARALPPLSDFRARQSEREAQIQEAEAELAALGYPQPAIYRQTLVWSDHDQFRHVNNVRYIRWMESARMYWLQQLASRLPQELYEDLVLGRNVGVILATNFCRYRRPLVYPDTVLIGQGIRLPLQRDDRFTVQLALYSVNQRAVVAEGENEVVTYDYNRLRKAPMPAPLRDELEAWGYRGNDRS